MSKTGEKVGYAETETRENAVTSALERGKSCYVRSGTREKLLRPLWNGVLEQPRWNGRSGTAFYPLWNAVLERPRWGGRSGTACWSARAGAGSLERCLIRSGYPCWSARAGAGGKRRRVGTGVLERAGRKGEGHLLEQECQLRQPKNRKRN